MSHLMSLWIAAPSFLGLSWISLSLVAVLDFLLAQLCRSFGFASTRFELRSPGFTRPEIRCRGLRFAAVHFALAHRTSSLQSRRPSGNPLLGFWRSVGLVFHFEILRISPFHRPTPHGAFTSFSPAKIRFLDYSALCAPAIRSKILRIFSLISELEMLRVSGFALTLPKIRYRPRLMFFITRPIIFISTFESGVSTSFLYFLLSDIISSVPSSFRLNLFARHSLFEQNT